MALDEATTTLLQQLAESGAKPLHEMTPQEARGLTAALGEMYGPGPDMHRAEMTMSSCLYTCTVSPTAFLLSWTRRRGLPKQDKSGAWTAD